MNPLSLAKPAVTIVFASLFCINSHSQNKDKDSTSQLEQVVITAQKRAEILQKIPFAVTSISSKQADDFRLWNVKDITAIVPNLYSADPGDGRDVTAVRGIATTSYDPATTVYIDGVNQFGLDTYIPVLFDIERIEVLRGPQGSLYGRNAMGGVINIITKQPANATSGMASYSIGNYGHNRLQLSLKTPVVHNKLFLGASLLYDARNGFYTNKFTHQPYDTQHGFSGNYFLKYLANEKWSAILNVKHRNQQNNGAFPLVMGTEYAIAHPYTLNQNATTTMMDNTLDASLSIQYTGAAYHFSSQTAYQSNYRYYTNPIDGDFSPLDGISIINNYGSNWNNIKVWTQDIKFTSPNTNNSRLKWTAGTYLFYQDAPVKQGTRFGADANRMMMVGDSLFTLINTTNTNKKGIAFYGQVAYALSDRMNLSFGLRNDYEQQSQSVLGQYQHDPGNALFDTRPDTSATIHFNAWSPKLALDYQFNQNTMGYAIYSRGFRTGGLSPLSSDPSQPPLVGFNPEYSNNYELGLKNSLLSNRLRLNIAIFYTKVNDAQVPSLVLPDAITITKNVGKLNSKGVELELMAQATKALFVQYSFGYTNAVFESLQLSQQGVSVNLNGKKQLFTPDITSMLAVQYSHSFSPKHLTAFIRGEWKYLGTTYFDLANTIQQKPYSLLNANIGLSCKKTTIRAWARNIAGQKYIAYAYDFGAVHLGDPSTFGVTLSYGF